VGLTKIAWFRIKLIELTVPRVPTRIQTDSAADVAQRQSRAFAKPAVEVFKSIDFC
jgi:hypothetical protein